MTEANFLPTASGRLTRDRKDGQQTGEGSEEGGWWERRVRGSERGGRVRGECGEGGKSGGEAREEIAWKKLALPFRLGN